MNDPSPHTPPSRSDLQSPRLQRHLYYAARRLRDSQQLRERAQRFRPFALAALPVAVLGFVVPAAAEACLYLVAAIACFGLVYAWLRQRDLPLDYLAAARAVEKEQPDLKQSLVTAVEQQIENPRSFLTARVTDQALSHANRYHWSEAGKRVARRNRLQYLGTLAGALAVIALSYFSAQRDIAQTSRSPYLAAATETAHLVEPGNTEVERGSSLVITARFTGPLPETVSLVATRDDGSLLSVPMARSLSDPVYAHTLQGVDQGLRYHIQYADTESESYRLAVYDLPRLARADADLRYPDYTGWQDRSIEDTRRISAIEGSELDYRFSANKPIRDAYLVDASGNRLPLASTGDSQTQFRFSQTLSESRRYTLHLTDLDGRPNPNPEEIRIDVLPNERPSLRLANPRGDERVSPLQEMAFQGEARDDFGLLDYGVGIALSAESPQEISLTRLETPSAPLIAELSHLLPLEPFGLEPKDSFSYYLWADDFGPDGQPRRSTSDLYFAEVRALDEIFREQDGGGGQGGQGNPGEELLNRQKRVSISLFRIRNTATDAEAAIEDLDVVQRSQLEIMQQLRQLVPQLQEPPAREAAEAALRFMEGVDVSLTRAVDRPTLDPLEGAWSDSQSAFQELLRLTESEYSVSRSPSQGGGGGPSRNQSQLNQLEFRQEENRYETATEAELLSNPEERQNLELMSKLNELSRRQQDLNSRLQEMQNALAEAQSEEEKERIQRELKRLEEEQRDLLSQADEAIQQTGTRQSARQARQQLEEARNNMQESSEQLEQGEVSQALASGSRAQETIDQTREQLRNQSSSEFAEAMREARDRARQLAEQQQAIEQRLEELANTPSRSLDDSQQRREAAEQLQAQSKQVEQFLQQLQDITAGAEAAEPGLYRQLYDVLRQSNGARFEDRYNVSSQLLRQGFLDDALEGQAGLSEELEAMSEQIASAAAGILGDETSSLQFAEAELESLRRQLLEERPDRPRSANRPDSSPQGEQSDDRGSAPGAGRDSTEQAAIQSERSDQTASSDAQRPGQGQPGDSLADRPDASPTEDGSPNPSASPTADRQGSGRGERPSSRQGSSGGGGGGPPSEGSLEDMIQNALADIEDARRGPITGGGFSEWIDRLRTVESLIEDPRVRSRVTEARETAEDMRRDFKRHGELPQWDLIDMGVGSPLDEVRGWLAEEINRLEDPDALQPVDRDPVPQEYSELVRRYYESLGE